MDSLSNALLYGALALAANRINDAVPVINDAVPVKMQAPISLFVYPLLERVVSLVGKNFLPESLKVLTTFTATLFFTDKIGYYFGRYLYTLNESLRGSYRIKSCSGIKDQSIPKIFFWVTGFVLIAIVIK